MENKFKYDAFISYRHTELDKFVAENLHKQLESFRLPKSVAKKRKGQKNKIERVFRDKEELPLTSNLEDPILQALQSSEWLIVICSPRLRESLWCRKEIETFVALRGRERVLAVLIEGEPAESFPDELLFKVEKRTLPDGSVEEVKIPVEPLAADVRGKNKKQMLKAMKTEVLRLLAAMFQLNYDDLRQRHRERRMRRIMTASLIGGAACLLFGVYSTATALRIQKQKEQIEAQSVEIQAQSDEIKLQSEEIQKQNDELALRQARSLAELAEQALEEGDRVSAINTAVEALTESDGIALPYTPEAQMVLADSLRVYDTGNIYKADYQFETAGVIDAVKISPDWDTLVLYDETNTLTLFDLKERELIETFDSREYDKSGLYGCTFFGEDKFVYVNANEVVCVYDLNERSVIKKWTPEYAGKVFADNQGKYLAVELWGNEYAVYNGETLEEVGTTPEIETGYYGTGPFIFSDGIMACISGINGTYTEQEYTIHFIDLNTMQIISTYSIGNKESQSMKVRDGIAYIAARDYSDSLLNCDAYACAVDIAGGNLLWEYEQKGYWAEDIELPVNEGAKYLNFLTNGSAVMLDMQTGEVSFNVALASSPAESNVYINSNQYLLFCEDGEMIFANAEERESLDVSYKFECKTTSNEEILNSSYGIVVLGRNDNKITVYTMQAGPEVVEIDREVSLPEKSSEILGEEAIEIASTFGLENPELVNSLYYSEDKKYCFVHYNDLKFVIYDVEAGQIAHTMDWAYPTDWCLGQDSQGYTYLLGYYGCYILNENMEPFMWLPEATEVDMENQKVYMSWYGHYYEAPIYNLDELLEKAETYDTQE